MISESLISIAKSKNCSYPKPETLFRPSNKYPEYPYEEISSEINSVYEAVRESFYLLGLDRENYNTRNWNPLGEFIKPGNKVLLKPNLVMHINHNKQGGELCLYTQPSIVAAVLDYVVIALKGSGKIIVGDAPMQECDFNRLVKESGYGLLIEYYKKKNINIEIIDFRELSSAIVNGLHYININKNAKGTVVNLGCNSEFYGIPSEKLKRTRVTNYDPRILPSHHHDNIHEYYISQQILDADVIINLPKPKTHRKAGFTSALKNFVGANVRKEFLPHHTIGAVKENGDEYLVPNKLHRLQSKTIDKLNICVSENKYARARFWWLITKFFGLIRKFMKNDSFSEGSWYGNHTISKTICDLNKIINYADKQGNLCEEKQRTIFNVADIIVSGEKEGPVRPSPKEVGIIVSGFNSVCFDEVIATLMGFDINKIPTLVNARKILGKYGLIGASQHFTTVSNAEELNNKSLNDLKKTKHYNFIPTSGWEGHIELQDNQI